MKLGRLGFRHTAFQAVCTVLVLCFALGLLERADTVQPVFGEDSVRVPILMYHSILRDSARQGKYVISPAVLAADLDALQEKGYTKIRPYTWQMIHRTHGYLRKS